MVQKVDFRPSVDALPRSSASFSFAKTGYLEKKASSALQGFQTRFFVASGSYLRYYKDSECAELLARLETRRLR